MFPQALNATLRILIFRAGPQDFPFSSTRGLTLGCIAFAVLTNALMASVIAPVGAAVLMALLLIGGVALVTRMTLTARKSMNRFQQTFNALLTTTGLLNLAMVPAMAVLAPLMLDFLQQVQATPEIVNQPEKWPQFPVWAELVIDAAGLWQLAVTSYIYRHAANVGVFGSILLVLGLVAAVFVLSIFASPLVAALAG
jgi:hypothetical protein